MLITMLFAGLGEASTNQLEGLRDINAARFDTDTPKKKAKAIKKKTKGKKIKYDPKKYGFKIVEGMRCPDFEVLMSNGKRVRIKEQMGKVVLIDFSGEFCHHCLEGMKKFEKDIFARFASQDLVVLPIFVKYTTMENVLKVCNRIGYHHPVGLDDGTIGKMFYEGGIPRYFVVNRKGRIVYAGPSYHNGQWEVMLERIAQALDKK